MSAQKNDVESIFTGALRKVSAEERSAYLDGACGDDTALRERVEELLRAHEEADAFLSLPTVEVSGGGESRAPRGQGTEGPGMMIDRYKLLQLIGEGGFGEVYMAEQQEPVRRKVALKIIKLGMDTKQVTGRFEAERQALAMMDHPNIAKVLDAGATVSGRLYFVMELVKGIPFTEYCDKNNLSTRDRLALFVPVCNAIQHAHNKGIIHRDIKPSNVLVTLHDGRPVPKVIDFGVAKATNQRLTEKTVFTEFRQFIGTPEYMSPEQAEMSGLDVDTRSDIYSLGVLLYELLTGTTPFDPRKLREAGYVEITRMIREDEPPAPSTRLSLMGEELPEIARHRHTEPGVLSRLLRGDLDWIVMTALEKDRTRRYETANALACDVERYLKDEPVLASPPSASYRFSKFVRRNRTVVVASAVVACAVLTGFALATMGFLQARRDRDAAEAARAEVEASRAQVIQERDRYQSVVRSLQATLAGVDPDRVKELEPGARGVLDIAREVVAEASPMPVSFGKYAEIDALRAVNWTSLGETVLNFNRAAVELYRQIRQDQLPDQQLRSELQHENAKLIKFVSGIVGQIPTHGVGGNGEFTHPVSSINLMASALDVAGRPLSTSQKALIAAAGEGFQRDYDRLQSTYTDQTPMVEKLIDEIELKRDCMRRVEKLLTPEQRQVVILPELRGRSQFDLLSPILMVTLLAQPKDFPTPARVQSSFVSHIASRFDLDSARLEAHSEVFDAWYEEVAPILAVPVEENELLHIDQVITAGRAHAHLVKALAQLDDVDDTARRALLADYRWSVPRITSKSIEAVRASVQSLRKCCPREERLADALTELGTLLGDVEDREEAIPVLIEAIDIYRSSQGDTWNSDPLRYKLRGVVRAIAFDPHRVKESYEAALRGAEVVVELKPTSGYSLNTLGVLQYRLGRYDDALATLGRSESMRSARYKEGHPLDVAFIAMAQLQLDRLPQARATFARLRRLMESRQFSDIEENQRILREAQTLFDATDRPQ